MTPTFKKPSRKPRDEPAGLDAFANGAPPALGIIQTTIMPPSSPAILPTSAPTPPEEGEIHGMNIRFTTSEKELIERLATEQERSQHQIVKRLLRPALRNAVSHPPPKDL